MKRLIKTFAFTALILAMSACSNSDEANDQDNNSTGAVVSIKLINPETRADGTPEPGTGVENTINTLDFYIFQSTGEYVQTNSFTSAQPIYNFVVENPGDNMRFLVAINQSLGDVSGFTFDETRALISNSPAFTKFTKPATDGNTTTAPTSFAMSGWTVATVNIANDPLEREVTNVRITVNRLVSKVETPELNATLTYEIPEEELELVLGTGVTDVTFSLDGFVLINGIDKTDAFYTWNAAGTETSTWDTWSRTGKTYLSSTFDGNGDYVSAYAATTADDMFLDPADGITMYVYENMPEDDQDSPDFYFNKNTVYSFIIKGTLTDVSDTSNTAVRYWRINLIPDDNQKVIRNAIYRVTINGLRSIGYGTPEDAENEVVPKEGNSSVQITITVAPWRVKTTGVII